MRTINELNAAISEKTEAIKANCTRLNALTKIIAKTPEQVEEIKRLLDTNDSYITALNTKLVHELFAAQNATLADACKTMNHKVYAVKQNKDTNEWILSDAKEVAFDLVAYCHWHGLDATGWKGFLYDVDGILCVSTFHKLGWKNDAIISVCEKMSVRRAARLDTELKEKNPNDKKIAVDSGKNLAEAMQKVVDALCYEEEVLKSGDKRNHYKVISTDMAFLEMAYTKYNAKNAKQIENVKMDVLAAAARDVIAQCICRVDGLSAEYKVKMAQRKFSERES